MQNELEHIDKYINMIEELEELNSEEVIELVYLNPDLSTSINNHTLPDAILQYVSRTLAISQDEIEYIEHDWNTDRYFAEENGLYELRYKGEIASKYHGESSKEALGSMDLILQILTIIVTIGMFFTALFLIPVIRRVDRST